MFIINLDYFINVALSNPLQFFFKSAPGLEQYGIKKFAQALEVLPQAIAENTGAKVKHLSFNLLIEL